MSVRDADLLNLIGPLDYARMVSAVILHGKREHWMVSLLSFALELIKAKEIFNLNSLRGGSFIENQDKEMFTLYAKKSTAQRGCTYLLPNNYHLRHINILAYTLASVNSVVERPPRVLQDLDCMNHVQKPDVYIRLNFKMEEGSVQQMAIVYEAECHNKDAEKEPGKGGFLCNKMFQAIGRCHDTNAEVSGVVICSVMFKHNKENFASRTQTCHFDRIACAFLQAHVRLLYYLIEYNRVKDKDTSWIGGQLKKKMKGFRHTDVFDFACAINVTSNNHVCSSNGEGLFATLKSGKGAEYTHYLRQMRRTFGAGNYNLTDCDINLGERLQNWEVTYERLTFNTTVDEKRVGMKVVIYCVLRAPRDALVNSAARRPDPIRGVLYPLHINALVSSMTPTADLRKSLINAKQTKLFRVHSRRLYNLLVWRRMNGPQPDVLPYLWFGFGVHTTINIWNLEDHTVEQLTRSVSRMNLRNARRLPAQQEQNVIEKFRQKRGNHNNIALSCELTGYLKFILPLMYLGMASFIKISDDLQYSTGSDDTHTAFDEFVDSKKEDNVVRGKNSSGIVTSTKSGALFSSRSKSLFKTIISSMHEEHEDVEFDPLLEAFLQKECGWENIHVSSSPAMIFKILGVTHLLSAHNFAKQVVASPPPRYTEILQTFPAGLQIEVDFVMRELAGHTLFKTNFWQNVQEAVSEDDTDQNADDEDETDDEV